MYSIRHVYSNCFTLLSSSAPCTSNWLRSSGNIGRSKLSDRPEWNSNKNQANLAGSTGAVLYGVPADGPMSYSLLLARSSNNLWDLHNFERERDSVWLNELFLCPLSAGQPYFCTKKQSWTDPIAWQKETEGIIHLIYITRIIGIIGLYLRMRVLNVSMSAGAFFPGLVIRKSLHQRRNKLDIPMRTSDGSTIRACRCWLLCFATSSRNKLDKMNCRSSNRWR